MTLLLAAWKYRRLIALVGGIFVLAALGVVIWGQHATIAGQAETIVAKDGEIKLRTDERDTAIATANQNAAELVRYKAERDAADAVAAENAQRTTERNDSVAEIHKEIAHVVRPVGPAPAVGPYTATALARLRLLKAGAAANAHPDQGGKGSDPGAAAVVPARP